jgi:tRNA (mo5U34)-methyltransferase
LTKTIQFDWQESLNWLRQEDPSTGMQSLVDRVNSRLSPQRYGDLPAWMVHFNNLPEAVSSVTEFQSEMRIGAASDLAQDDLTALRNALEGLIPWRKGPISLFDQFIDTEWRSDWKWDRVQQYLDLQGKTVLDVGCGNGYHMWRALASEPARVLGIDPSPRFVVQFYMLKKYYGGEIPIDLLPVGIQDLPGKALFDTVLSMGVLYHRKSPMDHLVDLMNQLKPGGQLLLETLVIEGGETEVLVPEGRYAKMPNVWFLPSVAALTLWMKKSGFIGVECIDESVTSLEEQRTTDWMRFHSLEQYLDQDNSDLTFEGHPRPRRAALIATKPE